ncbi:MAG: ATP-binding protein, partial [Bacteroidota bacterium]
KDGKLIDVEGSTDPILDDNGEIIGFLGIQKDNTERKKYEEGLKEAKEQAEELSRLKSSFLANMSHELRTPMIGILGFSELLIDEKDINTVNDYANMINESGKRLMSTLNSILDLSRIESGELKLNLKYLDVCEVMNNLVDLYSVSAKNKNLNLSFNSPIQSIMLSTDSQALTSIFGNIISNAVKYTEKGSIEISMEKEIINDKDWLVTIVSDTGIGIDSSNIDIIFKEFRQVSEGIDRNFEGSGLGLTITKKYVDLLGGTITVDSKIGKGTTFIIKLPIGTELMETSDKLSRESISNLQNINTSRKNIRAKMLYVEDDSISAILVNTIVRNIIDVEIAINATDAIEKAKANSYDIILMDINLGSGKDGLYATKEIRKLKSYSNIPIIAVTAFAMVGDKEDFLSKGCDYYISKPYNGENLINSIKQALNS